MNAVKFSKLVSDATVSHPAWFALPSDAQPMPGEVWQVQKELGATRPPD